jgi:sugar lactone lactonase YvrE/enterochelin esterase-like enzyme
MRLPIFALLATAALAADEKWKGTPDHEVQDVPHGTVTRMPAWESKLFAGTTREWWVYVPAQFKPDGSAAVMVFQDGHDYVNVKGNWRVPVVFDNLIAKGEMPATVAIFLNPGHRLKPGEKIEDVKWKANNRSLEYDSLGDRYARFLIEEILPEVERQWPLSKDPEKRAICGASSGGICSFTVAWERPDAFRKVLSTIGSFVNLRGGNAYPSLIRKTERKPVRVFLEDAGGDLDNPFGNWPLANKQMHAALNYMGYDVRFDFADGYGHNSNHGGSIFPDALRWLWRPQKHTPLIGTKGDLGGDLTLHRLLIEGEGWNVAAEGHQFTDAPCPDSEGNLWFCDLMGPNTGLYRIAPDGTKTRVNHHAASGMKFLPGDRTQLIGCQGSKKRIAIFTTAQHEGASAPDAEVVATDVQPNDLVVTPKGYVYFTETGKQQVTLLDLKTKQVRAVDTGITGPNGIALSPDGGTLAVSDHRGGNAWTFRIEADGSLSAKAPTMTLRRPIDAKGDFKFNEPPPFATASGGDGMAVDAIGRFFVTSALGVQVFDPTSRECGLLTRPIMDRPLTSCALAGEFLYITNGGSVYRRRVQVKP